MSLSSSMGMAGNSLQINNISLQVVGQNLANANTEGYIRERAILSPGPSQKYGSVTIGTGVRCLGVQQVIDEFLESRVRTATSDMECSARQEETYQELEALIGELTDSDISSSMSNFFNSISNVMNSPESESVRRLVSLQGDRMTRDINRLGDQVQTMRIDMNDRVDQIAVEINDLLKTIQTLNIRIAETEAGDVSSSDAVGLRDQRLEALTALGSLIDIRVEEQKTNGAVTVYCGANYLVYDGEVRSVFVETETEGEIPASTIRIEGTNAELDCRSGELYGVYQSRDVILSDFAEKFDSFVKDMIFEFNKIHSSGQGLSGYKELTSLTSVSDVNLPLTAEDLALPYTPENGSFEILVKNKATGLTEKHTILVEMDGADPEVDNDSLKDLAAKINAVDGVTATTTVTGELKITSDSKEIEFAFAEDTSSVLAVLGINTFFSGSNSRDIGIVEDQMDDPTKFAASMSGIGVDTDSAILMAELPDKGLESRSDMSLLTIYKTLMSDTAEGSATSHEQAISDRTFQGTLYSQKLAISGVNIDEETIKLMTFQQAYQANAKYVSTISDLLLVLINM